MSRGEYRAATIEMYVEHLGPGNHAVRYQVETIDEMPAGALAGALETLVEGLRRETPEAQAEAATRAAAAGRHARREVLRLVVHADEDGRLSEGGMEVEGEDVDLAGLAQLLEGSAAKLRNLL